MKIFIDSADLDEIQQGYAWGVVDGVTTNPSLLKKAVEKRVDAGEKIDLKEYFSMPPHRRAAFQLLKNANIVPAEVSILKEINQLEAQLSHLSECEDIMNLRQEIQFKRIELRIALEKYRK